MYLNFKLLSNIVIHFFTNIILTILVYKIDKHNTFRPVTFQSVYVKYKLSQISFTSFSFLNQIDQFKYSDAHIKLNKCLQHLNIFNTFESLFTLGILKTLAIILR